MLSWGMLWQVETESRAQLVLGSSLLHLRGVQQPELPQVSANGDILLFNGRS